MARMTAPILLAAGGTGGHLMPAQALADVLEGRGHACVLVTDARGAEVPGVFTRTPRHIFDAGRMTGAPLRKLVTGLRIANNVRRLRRLFRQMHPAVVVGFGGYPALSALLAARLERIPTVIHEQNAVLGRSNRLLAPGAVRIALSFEQTRRVPASAAARSKITGNPVRREISELAGEPYPPLDSEHMLRLLVLGGSLGARILSEVVPDALALLPPHLRQRLQVSQQCRSEDLERARQRYADSGIAANLDTFFEDVPERLRWAHLVIARAGASTLAELTAAGRPAILVPLPIATDDHQTVNVIELVEAGGGWAMPQNEFTPAALAKRIQSLARAPDALESAAAAAQTQGRPRAAEHLADLVDEVIAEGVVEGKSSAPTDEDSSHAPHRLERREALA